MFSFPPAPSSAPAPAAQGVRFGSTPVYPVLFDPFAAPAQSLQSGQFPQGLRQSSGAFGVAPPLDPATRGQLATMYAQGAAASPPAPTTDYWSQSAAQRQAEREANRDPLNFIARDALDRERHYNRELANQSTLSQVAPAVPGAMYVGAPAAPAQPPSLLGPLPQYAPQAAPSVFYPAQPVQPQGAPDQGFFYPATPVQFTPGITSDVRAQPWAGSVAANRSPPQRLLPAPAPGSQYPFAGPRLFGGRKRTTRKRRKTRNGPSRVQRHRAGRLSRRKVKA